jgi:hypothetical protein
VAQTYSTAARSTIRYKYKKLRKEEDKLMDDKQLEELRSLFKLDVDADMEILLLRLLSFSTESL